MLSSLLNIIFPKFCCGCSKLGTYLCDDCYESFEFYLQPLELSLPKLALDEVRVAIEYQEPIKSLLHELKYQGVKDLANWCGTFLYYTVNLPEIDLITSIPMHPKKQRDRGYNQAELIAQQLAFHLHKPYQSLLIKSRHTVAQAATKTKEERQQNLDQAFSIAPEIINKPAAHHQLQTKKILIIDDVITTGSTMNSCAKVLKGHGFQYVSGLAVAHGF